MFNRIPFGKIWLERHSIARKRCSTSGTTWHAAGLIGQLGSSATITKLRNYSLNLYRQLEKETGLSTGLKQNGSLTVATTQDRLEEL